MTVRRSIQSQKGSAMVEAALVLPILALLLFGILDFSRAFNYWNDANQLAAEAARHAAVNRNPGACGQTGQRPCTTTAPNQSFEDYIICRAETQEFRGPAGPVCPPDADGEPAEGVSDGTQAVQVGRLKVCMSVPQGTDIGDPITIKVRNRFWVIPLVREALDVASLDLVGEATMRLEQKFTQTLPLCT